MSCLPDHGRVSCSLCYGDCSPQFDVTKRTEGDWRITANPLSWGNTTPEVVVLGFSKGPTQAGALTTAPHDEIAYKGGRGNVGKIIVHIGLLPASQDGDLASEVSKAIADPSGRFHFGSLVRCTVERYEKKSSSWKGSGGGMLDKFVATPFGQEVANNCAEKFLSQLPASTKLVVMFGLGSKLNYVQEAFKLYQKACKGPWRWLNEVAYTNGSIVVVHVEHFASQGALIPQWMGKDQHERGQYGRMAQDAVRLAFKGNQAPIAGNAACVQPLVEQISRTRSKMDSSKRKIKMKSDNSESDVLTLMNEFIDAGYTETKNIDKVAGYKGPSGEVIYLVKTTSSLNRITLIVNPNFPPEMLRGLDGADAVSSEHRFHSNMSGFPKRINKGETPTAYGWQVTLDSLQALPRFLKAFGQVHF